MKKPIKDGVNYFLISGKVLSNESKFTKNGKQFAKISVEVGKNKKRFFLTAWEDLAEEAEKSVAVEALHGFEGYIGTNSWNDKETGKKVYRDSYTITGLRVVEGGPIQYEEKKDDTPF